MTERGGIVSERSDDGKAAWMRAVHLLAASLLLASCAEGPPLAYTPLIYDAHAYAADVAICRDAAKAYQEPVSAAAIGEAGASAGVRAIPQAAVSPLAVGLSALGGAGGTAIDELGLTGHTRARVFLLCLDRLTEWDRSAVVADPRL